MFFKYITMEKMEKKKRKIEPKKVYKKTNNKLENC